MPKKTGGGGHYNFIFFLNYVLRKTERMPGEPTGRTLAFSYKNQALRENNKKVKNKVLSNQRRKNNNNKKSKK
jgi:hypothetical protein